MMMGTQLKTRLFEARSGKAIDAQHERGRTDKSGGHEKNVIVNTWNGAQYKADHSTT